MNEIRIVPFATEHRKAFKELNEAWIKKYFEMEEGDTQTLNQPEKIIEKGGFIFVALKENIAVGVCALKKISHSDYEFSKMAVAEHAQGLGIGRKLAEAAISKARQIGAKRIYLEGNTSLEASIHLYKKVGFKEIHGQHSQYKRVNIIMEKLL